MLRPRNQATLVRGLASSSSWPRHSYFATHRQISRVNRLLATLPKTHPCKSFVCHTCDTPGGACALSGNLGELCVSALSFPQRHSFNAERLTRGHPPLFPPNLEAAFLPVPSANCWP